MSEVAIGPDQIRRYDTKLYIKRNPLVGTCVICGGTFGKCGHSSSEVTAVFNAIEKLSESKRKEIFYSGKAIIVSTDKSTTQKADDLIAKANELLKAAEELKAQAAKEATQYRYPAEPPFTRGSIAVKFRGNSQWYEYLVVRVPGKGFYTTGQGETSHFTTWRKFVDWLRSDDVADCGKFTSLMLGTTEIVVP